MNAEVSQTHIVASDEFNKDNHTQWNDSARKLLGVNEDSRVWTELKAICDILNSFLVHESVIFLFPDHGGSDVKRFTVSPEHGCITLTTSQEYNYLVKPIRLSFYPIAPKLDESFFFLEIDRLRPLFKSTSKQAHLETVFTLPSSGDVLDCTQHDLYKQDQDYFDESRNVLPPYDFYRIERVLVGGGCVITPTTSLLNQDEYNGALSMMGPQSIVDLLIATIKVSVREQEVPGRSE